jgi:hypothetical protein
MEDGQPTLRERAQAVLHGNDQGTYTIPASGLYPHQWLWDSCFIAIGLRHYDIERAKTEILSLLRGQWANGMLPHMILSSTDRHIRDGHIWRSWSNPNSPDELSTSGITQPPMLAEAVVQVGRKLPLPERRNWYKAVYPALVRYHQWLYTERDPHNEGLVLLIHPWETGLDNTPVWTSELHQHMLPLWIRIVGNLRLDWLINLFRRDTKFVSPDERLSALDALAFYSVQRRLRRKAYDIDKILTHSMFSIEDLTFNCILIRANQHLQAIATSIREDLPDELLEHMARTEAALSELWDPYSGQYFSRNFVTHKLIKEPSIAALMPLYAGCISRERAAQLVKMLENTHLFGPAYPVPSVPVSSTWFNPVMYWQGPTWINTNWLIIDGLRRAGFDDHADVLAESTLELLERNGCYEYFNPLTGEPAGAENFSWSAALGIDLLQSQTKPPK